MSKKLLDFLRATENYRERGTVIRVSDPKSKEPGVVLTKQMLPSHFNKAIGNANAIKAEICRKKKDGTLEPIVAYREVKLGTDTGIFLD